MPEPVATGTLAKTPLPHLLVYLEQKKLSGTLAIWPDVIDANHPGQDRILFLKGHPVAGRLIEPASALRDGLLTLFYRSEAPYAFYEANLLGDDRLSGRVDPLSLIAESLRLTAREEIVAGILSRYTGPVRLQAGVELDRYGFQPGERSLVELLQAHAATIDELVAACGLPAVRARRILYLLAITRALGLAQAGASPMPSLSPGVATRSAAPAEPQQRMPSAPPPRGASVPPSAAPQRRSPSSSPPPAAAAPPEDDLDARFRALDRLNNIPPPPPGLSDELQQRWQRIVARGRLIENQNYFEMLELPRDASATDARNKFYQLAKEWHPDRLPQELQPLREYVQTIFTYLSEANGILGNEEDRVKYIQNVREGGGTPRTERLMQTILDSAMQYERVLVMTRKHDYDGALEVLTKILGVVKDEPDYHAMHAWLLLQKHPGPDAPLNKMLDAADRALKLYQAHEKGNLCKAQVLRRMGRNTAALEYFRKVVDINPNNIEAAREVRVATMRSSGRAKAKNDKSGLLGKLFGKK